MLERAIKNNQDSSKRTWVFCRGLTAYKKGRVAIEQDIKSALLEFKYDCYWALQSGIDWVFRLGNKNQKELLDEDILTVIQNRYGVVSVQNFNSVVIDRSYTFKCDVFTIFSEDSFLFEFSVNI